MVGLTFKWQVRIKLWKICDINPLDPTLDRSPSLRRPLFAVPNVTAHPSKGQCTIVLLYDGPFLCGFNVAIKGLKIRGIIFISARAIGLHVDVVTNHWNLHSPAAIALINTSIGVSSLHLKIK